MDSGLRSDLRTLLNLRTGSSIELRVVEQLRAHVWRLTVDSADSAVPATVIARVGPERAEGELQAGIGWSQVFAAEWAGSKFLGGLEPIRDAVPTVLADDVDAQLLITEDLGTGPSLVDLLNGVDATSARVALVEHARLLGRIAAVTQPRTVQYRELRARGGPGGPASLLDELSSAELRRVLARCEQQLGIAPPVGLDAELEAVDLETREPGRWLAYTPADACPDNNVVTDAGVRLFDFGFGGLRHVALDAAYSLIPFPTCWCSAQLPGSVSEEMLAAFRAELVTVLAEADDDEVWMAKLAWACAAWFVGYIGAVAIAEIDRDEQRGHLTGRQVAVGHLTVIADTTSHHYPAIAELADRLATTLSDRWNIGTIAPYPALVDPAS